MILLVDIGNTSIKLALYTELIQHDANVDSIVEDMKANLSNNDEKTHHLKQINTSLEATDFSSFAVKLYEDCRG